MEPTASDEGIPTEGVVQSRPWPTHPKNDVHDTTGRRPGSGCLKSYRMTDNIAVVCRTWSAVRTTHPTPTRVSVLCGALYRSTF